MSAVRSPLSDSARSTVGGALQGSLVDLVDLSLIAKQLHWNVTGRNFRSVHKQLDDVVAMARRYSDAAAERSVAIGMNPDGQAATIVARTGLSNVDVGYISDDKVVSFMTDCLGTVISRMRRRMDDTAEPDPVTQDLLIDIIHDVEEQHWMFQAMV
jgi:starvation-inducible DNA-binding protein